MGLNTREPSPGQLELALLRANLHSFGRVFYNKVGPRYVELNDAYAQAAKLRLRFMPSTYAEAAEATEQTRLAAEECAAGCRHDAAEPQTRSRLHRELARAFHPDLASDQARRLLREQLMKQVNLAYSDGDLTRLKLLESALDHDENGDAARQLARWSLTPLAQLCERAEYAGRHGTDLLAELAAHIQGMTDDVRQRGARAARKSVRHGSLVARALADMEVILSTRRLAFPPVSMGELSMRAERDADAPLTHVGPAAWGVELPFGQALILRLSAKCGDLTPLRALDPEDLHGLIDEWPDFVNLTDEQLLPLGHFRSLEDLRLGRTAITGQVFDRIAALHELRVLAVDDTQFDDHGLIRLEESVWMERLDLSGTRVTGEGLRSLRNMTALRELNLDKTAVADDDLAVLKRIPGLRSLELGLTKVTDGVAGHLSELQSLEILNLGGTAVSDALLDALRQLPALRELVLWETGISAKALDKLRDFPALRYVDVDDTLVANEAKAAFQKARPEVRLPSDVWQGGD